jgi:uncharacterized membrane protein
MYPPIVRRIRFVLYAVGLVGVVLGGVLKHQGSGWWILSFVLGVLSLVTVFLIGSLARAARQHQIDEAQRHGRRPNQKRR